MSVETEIERDPVAPYRKQFESWSEELSAEPEWLRKLRRHAFDRFSTLGFPTLKMEEWRFTNVGPIARASLRRARRADGEAPLPEAPRIYAGALAAVFVNGRFRPELSRLEGLPEGVFLGSLAQAMRERPERLEEHLGRHADADHHFFVALNTAFAEDGLVLDVPRGVVIEKPIHFLALSLPGEEGLAVYPRHLITVGENAQVTVVEDAMTVGDGTAPHFNCLVSEIALAEGAVVDHYKIEREANDAFHVAMLAIHQGRSSSFSSQSLSWGGGIVRNDVHAILDGEGADAILNGLYMVEGEQLVDNHMRVEHAKPNCTSHELYKGILEERSRAVFSGRIYVHPGAQKTDAKQTNRNLLLSREALCNSNPQLEIFADDVKCTHGSTVGQLDEIAVFYLRSRGIPEDAAKSLLTYAFASDIVERVKVPAVRADLEEFLFRRLPAGETVRQAV